MCCEYLDIREVPSPPGQMCKHCNKGCTIYEKRHESCRGFKCLWLAEPQIPERFRPDRCGMLFERPGDIAYIGHGTQTPLDLIKKINEAGFSVVIKRNIYSAGHSFDEVYDDLRRAHERIYNDRSLSNN